MATFSKLKSGSWRVQIRRKGQYASQTFRSRTDAKRWATAVERQIDASHYRAEPREQKVQFVADIIDLHVNDMRAVGRAPLLSTTYCLDQH